MGRKKEISLILLLSVLPPPILFPFKKITELRIYVVKKKITVIFYYFSKYI